MSDRHHAPAALPPRKKTGAHFTGGWVGPTASGRFVTQKNSYGHERKRSWHNLGIIPASASR